MFKTLFFFSSLSLILMLGGCAPSRVVLTVISDPPGANLYENEKSYGQCPTSLQYPVPPQAQRAGMFKTLNDLVVRWPSGAEAKIDAGTTILLSTGEYQTVTLVRPTGVPGELEDRQYGLEYQKLLVMQQQTSAMQDAAAAQRSANMWQAIGVINSQQKKMNCVSRSIGGTVYTDCK